MNSFFGRIMGAFHLPPVPRDLDEKERALRDLSQRQEVAADRTLTALDDIAQSQFPLEELIRRMTGRGLTGRL